MLSTSSGQPISLARPRRFLTGFGLIIAAAFAATFFSPNAAAQFDRFEYWVLPRAELDPTTNSTHEVIVLAGGCFWGVQAVYQYINGVESAISGYSGGSAATANYRTVGTGSTGHAEVVEVIYNPQIISTGEILRIFFSVAHDPTQLDRQNADIGSDYRSHIYYTTADQREVAEAYIAQLEAANIYEAPIVTRLDVLAAFYPAEGYHQDYLQRNPGSPYIQYWDLPKLANAQNLFGEYWRNSPVTVAATRPDLLK